MGRLQQVIDTRYNKALTIATIQIAIVMIVAGITLDGGGVLRQAACVVIVYLVIPAVVITVRPATPTPSDLLAIKYGFVIMVVAVLLMNTIYPPAYEWFNFRAHR